MFKSGRETKTTKDSNNDDKDIMKCYDKWDYIHLGGRMKDLVDFSFVAKLQFAANLVFSERRR